MLIFKFGKKSKLINYLFWTALDSLQSVFMAFILGRFIAAATKANMTLFLQNSVIAIVGFLIFCGISLLQVNAETRYVAAANLEIKQIMIKEILSTAPQTKAISDNISFMTNDLKLLETNGIKAEMDMVTNLLTFIFALVASLTYDIWTTLAFFVGSLVPLLISNFTQGRISQRGKEWSQANASFTNRLKDILTGKRTIRTYQAEATLGKKLVGLGSHLENSLRRMNLTIGVANSLAYTVAMLTAMTIPFGVGVYRIILGALTLASFISVMQLSNSIANPLMAIVGANNQRQTITEIQQRVLTAKQNQVAHAKNQSGLDQGQTIGEFSDLQLHNFAVTVDQRELFKQLNLKISAGEKVLITAPSGFGKSTLLAVLQDELVPSAGNYAFNGQPITQFSPTTVEEQFAWISQQPFAFDDTIQFNLTLGRHFSQQQIQQALQNAGLPQFSTDEGLNYQVGENGQNLSGGELQRLEIARAQLYDRPIILADEATSSLDQQTAEQVHQLFITSQKTLIEVAHQVPEDQLKDYDQVIRLDQVTMHG
ncbi:ATP-binding cassette domain-containing protein [Lapidilactobacillus wuchangensis]|uniref:ATP-binding cassette domain-containing protein n=1 Tax=Lapidilactobacillus wuchangensis TaxID=2486001 RepID=UPI000F7A5BDC|nr:ABC transporter ATP-binding protein [Lapidilactobacillus wuchangensis]